MQEINNSYGAFSEPFATNGQQGLVTIHPEMYPSKAGIAPLGSYFVFCVHPEHGSCTFIVEEDEKREWYSERHPKFIDKEFIKWIGERIENYSK